MYLLIFGFMIRVPRNLNIFMWLEIVYLLWIKRIVWTGLYNSCIALHIRFAKIRPYFSDIATRKTSETEEGEKKR